MDSCDVLVLDIMDTVVRDPVFRDVPKRFGCSLEKLFQWLNEESWVQFETGSIDEATYLKRMFARQPPPGMTSGAVRATILNGYRFVDGLEELLLELAARGTRIWALSNYPPWVSHIRHRLQLDRFFEGYAVSCDTGFRKPDPRAYTQLLETVGVAPEECLFVDDRQQNVEAARALQFNVLRFTCASELRRELIRQGLWAGPRPTGRT
jgi:putative hydrolase of the HAD superfamily